MRRCVVLVLAAGLLIGADKKEDAKKDQKMFQGSWVPVSVEVNGEEVPKEQLKDVLVTVKGNKVTFKEGDKTSEATFTLDPTKKPKQINGTAKEKDKEVKTIGIYEFDSGKLKICYTLEGGKRPTEFTSKGGTKEKPVFLAVYKRAKKAQ
jgi:uncharacterized protein (TIGR03067 family)